LSYERWKPYVSGELNTYLRAYLVKGID